MNKRLNNFNLVEVILAMGIVVVCITSIMGMFASGMQLSKEANTINYASNIAEQIAGLIIKDPSIIAGIPSGTGNSAKPGATETFAGGAVDTDDEFFKNVTQGSSNGLLKIEFKTSVTNGGTSAVATDFTAVARVWYDTTGNSVTASDGTTVAAGNTLHVEVTWPFNKAYNKRVLEGQVLELQTAVE